MLNLLTKYLLLFTVFLIELLNIMINRIHFNTRTRGSYIPGGGGGAYNWVNVLLSGKWAITGVWLGGGYKWQFMVSLWW